MVFFGQAVAQSNDPLIYERCGYNSKDKRTRDAHLILPADAYPWGVCFEYSDMWELIPSSSYYVPFSKQERAWTQLAMEKWNDGYNVYKFKIWETYDVPYIPDGPLFVKEYYRDQICNFTDYDFEAFLKPLALDSPDGKLMTREEVKQWNIESLIQDSLAGWEGDIAIECGRGSSLCGSITSFYYKERDRLREYYYGGQYDADLRQKKAQEWIDKFGGSTDTSYYRDRVNNRE